MCKVSVITITYNAEKYIEETMYSVLNQRYESFEYIIKDGDSHDRTNDIVESIINKREKNNQISILHVKEKDTGIYNAMNEAVQYASGEWIIFMNAGDCFYDENVLTDVFSRNYDRCIDVLYGHVMMKLINNRKFVVTYNSEIMKMGHCICHQGVFERKDNLLRYPFDENFVILGDKDHFLKLMEIGAVFEKINIIVAKEDRGGISAINYTLFYQEDKLLNEKYKLHCKTGNMQIGKIKKIIKKYFPIIEETFMITKNIKRME